MIIKFINKLYSELIEKKIEIESKHQEIKIKAENNFKYIQKLKKSEEESIDVFSPRKQNRNFQNNIKNLETEQQSLQKELELYNEELSAINTRLVEFEEIIQIAKQQEIQNKNMIDQLEQNRLRQKESNLLNILRSIVHKIEICLKFVDVDFNRCKIELNSLKKLIYEIIEEEEKPWH